MSPRSALHAGDVEGFRLEDLDGRRLGDVAGLGRRGSSRRRAVGLAAAGLGVLSVVSIALQARGDDRTPLWALAALAGISFAVGGVLLGGRSRHLRGRAAAGITALVIAPAVAGSAFGSAPPVGRLPAGPVTPISTRPSAVFVVSLPKAAVAGRVWRIARPYESSVVRGVREGETRTTVWLRFRAVAPGVTSLVFALTRGERSHVYAARTFRVMVG